MNIDPEILTALSDRDLDDIDEFIAEGVLSFAYDTGHNMAVALDDIRRGIAREITRRAENRPPIPGPSFIETDVDHGILGRLTRIEVLALRGLYSDEAQSDEASVPARALWTDLMVSFDDEDRRRRERAEIERKHRDGDDDTEGAIVSPDRPLRLTHDRGY